MPLSFSHGTCDNFGSSSGGTIEAPITLEGLKIATQGSEGANNLITREVTEPVGLMEMRRGALKFRQRLNRRSEFSCMNSCAFRCEASLSSSDDPTLTAC